MRRRGEEGRGRGSDVSEKRQITCRVISCKSRNEKGNEMGNENEDNGERGEGKERRK